MARYILHLGLVLTLGAAAYACGSDDEDDDNSTGSPGSTTNATSTNASTTAATTGTGGNGGTSSTGGAAGAGGTIDTCGGIGSPCNGNNCPNNLICYQSGNSPFCLPAQPPECGGFVGAECPARAPNCLYLQGADFGPCFTNEVKDCVCLNSPGAVTGC